MSEQELEAFYNKLQEFITELVNFGDSPTKESVKLLNEKSRDYLSKEIYAELDKFKFLKMYLSWEVLLVKDEEFFKFIEEETCKVERLILISLADFIVKMKPFEGPMPSNDHIKAQEEKSKAFTDKLRTMV
jgi:hypothetical protein